MQDRGPRAMTPIAGCGVPRGRVVVFLSALLLVDLVFAVVAIAVALNSAGLAEGIVRVESPPGCHWGLIPLGMDPSGEPALAEGDRADKAWCIRYIAGIEPGLGTLVSDPVYVQSPRELDEWFSDRERLFSALEGRNQVEVVIQRGPGQPVGLSLPLLRGGSAHGRAVFWVAEITGLALILVGIYVLLKRPRRSEALALLAVCQAALLCLVSTGFAALGSLDIAPRVSLGFYWANILGLALLGFSLVWLLQGFPVAQLGPRARRWVLSVLGGILALALGLEIGGVLTQAVLDVELVCLGGALVLLGRAAWTARSQVQKLQLRWMLWGLGTPIATALLTTVPELLSPGGRDEVANTLAVLSCVLGPVGIGFGILRYRLLDIEVVVRRTILGIAVVLGFSFAFHLVVVLLADRVSGLGPQLRMSFLPVLLTALVFAFVLQPVQTKLSTLLDRYFFRNQYHYRQILAQMAKRLVATEAPGAAVGNLLEVVTTAMEAPRAVVVLAPDRSLGPGWGRGIADLDVGVALWERVRALDGPTLLTPDPGSGDPLMEWMSHRGLDLVIPLRFSGAVVGAFLCAAPPGGRPLAQADVALLDNAVASLALSLGRAEVLETVRRWNAELEQRVAQRTAELEQTRLQLFQAEKMVSVGLLAAGVAHELNTPLGVVVSTIGQVQENLAALPLGDLQEQTQDLTTLCSQAALRAAEIVSNLRDFSRPSQHDAEFSNVEDGITATLMILAHSLSHRGVQVVREQGGISPVLCYPAMLNQVFMNLFLNAMQAMPGGGRLSIRTFDLGEDGLRIEVEDSGPGVPLPARPHIFDPFFTTKATLGGTGLGLSLCYTILTSHGGRIFLDESCTEGARFVVELPRRIAARATERE